MKKIALLIVASVVMILSNLSTADVDYGVYVPYYQQEHLQYPGYCGAASLKMWLCHENEEYGNSNCYKSQYSIFTFANQYKTPAEEHAGFDTSPRGANAVMSNWGVNGPYNRQMYTAYDSGTYWQAQSIMQGNPVMALTNGGGHWVIVNGVRCQNWGCNAIKGIYVKDPWPGVGSVYYENTSSRWRATFTKLSDPIYNQWTPEYYMKWINVRKT